MLRTYKDELELTLEVSVKSDVMGLASLPLGLVGKDSVEISSDSGSEALRWADRNFSHSEPTLFTQPSRKIFFKGNIPPNSRVPLAFLHSQATTAWVEKLPP
ncbi:MAG: hypothetical protein ACK58L_13565 [Planctomycetota bacterium]